MHRRDFFRTASLFASPLVAQAPLPYKPNVIIMIADDLGRTDLQCYGGNIPTPNLDTMAAGGVRFTDFLSGSSVCSPSRASLLTGKYAPRVGVPNVLFPEDKTGIIPGTPTIASTLRDNGYSTASIGKWHLGSSNGHWPSDVGFDSFYGIPYSADMSPPLIEEKNGVQQTLDAKVDISSLTELFTKRAVETISTSKNPFFLYHGYSTPHIPLQPKSPYKGMTGLGTYADVVAELDASVGSILLAVTNQGIADNTLIIFTSDHGPWYQGSAYPYRGRKGDTWDGGMQVPCIVQLGNSLKKGTIGGFANALDIYPTIAALCGAAVDVDGENITAMLTTAATVKRKPFLYINGYTGTDVQCVRDQNYKLHLARFNTSLWTPAVDLSSLVLDPPELYDMSVDPSESTNCADEHKNKVESMTLQAEEIIHTIPDVANSWNDAKLQPAYTVSAGAYPQKIPQGGTEELRKQSGSYLARPKK